LGLDRRPHGPALVHLQRQHPPLPLADRAPQRLGVELGQHHQHELAAHVGIDAAQRLRIVPQGRLVGEQFGADRVGLSLVEPERLVELGHRLQDHRPPLKRPAGLVLGGEAGLLSIIQDRRRGRGEQRALVEHVPQAIAALGHVLLERVPRLLPGLVVHVDLAADVGGADRLHLVGEAAGIRLDGQRQPALLLRGERAGGRHPVDPLAAQFPGPLQGRRRPGAGRFLPGSAAKHPAVAVLLEQVGVEVAAQIDQVRLPHAGLVGARVEDHVVVDRAGNAGADDRRQQPHDCPCDPPPLRNDAHGLHHGSVCWMPWPSIWRLKPWPRNLAPAARHQASQAATWSAARWGTIASAASSGAGG